MTRRQLRESIFKLLFRIEFVSREECMEQQEIQMEELTQMNREEEDMLPEANEKEAAQMQEKLEDIFSHLDEIDTIIAAHSEGWNLNRIGKAELSILRLAVYEMKWDDTIPEKVAINEAVELAKTYCSEEAKGFVNAILGKMASGQD